MKNKQTSKGINKYVIILIIFLIAVVIGSIILFKTNSYNSSSGPNYSDFNSDKYASASKLYETVVNYDYLYSYPETVEEVMELYVGSVELLYGDLITNDELLINVINAQRNLYSNEVLELTTAEEQYNGVVADRNLYEESDIYLTSTKVDSVYYDFYDTNLATANVIFYFKNAPPEYKKFYLKNIDGQWKIVSWVLTDEYWNYE